MLEMLIVYDRLISDLIKQSNSELIIATGLSQKTVYTFEVLLSFKRS